MKLKIHTAMAMNTRMLKKTYIDILLRLHIQTWLKVKFDSGSCFFVNRPISSFTAVLSAEFLNAFNPLTFPPPPLKLPLYLTAGLLVFP